MNLHVNFPSELLAPSREGSNDEPLLPGTLSPALVVGLGSTGISVLPHLKKDLGRLFASSPDKLDMIQFLMLDLGEPEKQVMEQIERNDFLALPVENVRLTANHLKYEKPSFSRWWESNFTPPKKDMTDGTGGIRQLGRLALQVNIANVRRRLEEKIATVREACSALSPGAGDAPQSMKVFVVSSSCGGTGSGMLIDLLFMIYRLLTIQRGIKADVTLFLIMPGGFIDRLYTSFKQFRLLHANSYALFKELNALVTSGGAGISGEFCKYSIEEIPDEEKPRYRQWRPFARCFILDNRAQQSRIIPLERLFAITSRLLLTGLTAPVKVPETALRSSEKPMFGTVGYLRLHYRRAAMLEFCARKLAGDLVHSWSLQRYEETYSEGLKRSCRCILEAMESKLETGYQGAKIQGGFSDELEKQRKDVRALIPRFMSFSNTAKLMQAIQDAIPASASRADEFLNAFLFSFAGAYDEEKKSIMEELKLFLDTYLEEEGPALCMQVLDSIKQFVTDYAGEIRSQAYQLARREKELEDQLTSIMELIAQKKELNNNLEDFFDILQDRNERRMSCQLKKCFADALVSLGDGFREHEERLNALLAFLKRINEEVKAGLESLERARERDISAQFFPPDELESSPAVKRLYETYWNEEAQECHRREFVGFTGNFVPLKDIYASPDDDSAVLLLQVLYRYTAEVFNAALPLSLYENLLSILGGEEGLRKLAAETAAGMESVTLFEPGSGGWKERLLWCASARDRERFATLAPGLLPAEDYRYTENSDELSLIKLYQDLPLTSFETIKLCQDHYLYLVDKNAEDLEKKQQVRFPLHIERSWYEDFLSLPFLFLDG